MFDPTVFDNLKVAFENHVYDLDNLTEQIHITNRIDHLEMSVMSREFALEFTLVEQKEISAEIRLQASLKDLASEILEVEGEKPGCTLVLRFSLPIKDVSAQCNQIQGILQEIWQPDVAPIQTLSFVFGQDQPIYQDTIEMKFSRKINEDQMGDITELVDHVLRTLTELNTIYAPF
ncbi:hypothetical protein KZ483_25020 [Paenibacillus sp. sptzw28]|uniref:hypothetical protein n=1 Tax=Paenibacillus sp. sptzw28 TaxID=715179 RepID=UPI001C6E0D35|nr:hypothetical protein [Paenibacillus sp. sptzw28]QYR24321.1 hypothetical protein KZ483_25020 [Paenibacillus sp. sptzw28]